MSHRSFISNTYTGNLQIMDTQNDTTPYTAETTNSAGQVVPGVPVTITAGLSATFMAVSADLSKTMVYDPLPMSLIFIDNSTETVSTASLLAGAGPDGAVFARRHSRLCPGPQCCPLPAAVPAVWRWWTLPIPM